jgi:ACS family glucarate transporter-like MFS transporter
MGQSPFPGAETASLTTPAERPEQAAEPTAVRYGVLGFLAAMTFVLYLDRVCIGQAAPQMQRELGISETWMGVVFAAFTLSYAVFEVPTGRWGDRYGSRGVLTRIVVWWSFFTILTGAATGLIMLLIVRFLFGAGEAGALPNAARVLRQWFPESNRGWAQGIITTAMMIGGATAPVASQLLINSFGWRGTFVVFGVIGMLWALVFYFWFRDDPAEHPATNLAERRLIAGGRFTREPVPIQDGATAHEAPFADDIHAHGPIPWKVVLRNANIWLLGGAMMTMSAIYYMLISWYPKYLQDGRGASPDQSSWLASLVLGAGAIGCFAGGWLTDWMVCRTGSRRWGRTAQSVVGAGVAATGILASLFTDNTTLASLFVAIACLGVQIQVPAWWASATQVSGRHVGALFGLMNMIGALGAICSQLFLGRFADLMKGWGYSGRDQWDPGFFVYVAIALVGMTLWALINPEKSVEDPAVTAEAVN